MLKENEMVSEGIRASVAMAVYNGEKYLPEQLDSILKMLGSEDEIVISYDSSTDGTEGIITDYAEKDRRIVCVKNKLKKGVSGNFTNAARQCRGKYIFFSDQDDVWIGDKINRMVLKLEESGADLAIHDGYLTDADLNAFSESLFETAKANINPLSNFVRGRFLGCCMAFKREAMEYVLPFPDVTPDFPHDIFAAIMSEIKGTVIMVDEKYIYHRLHESNATPRERNKLPKVFVSRIILLWCIVNRLLRKK